jgi:hypothetical protein
MCEPQRAQTLPVDDISMMSVETSTPAPEAQPPSFLLTTTSLDASVVNKRKLATLCDPSLASTPSIQTSKAPRPRQTLASTAATPLAAHADDECEHASSSTTSSSIPSTSALQTLSQQPSAVLRHPSCPIDRRQLQDLCGDWEDIDERDCHQQQKQLHQPFSLAHAGHLPLSCATSFEVCTCWAELPDDVLRRIVEYLPLHTLRVVRAVCCGWKTSLEATVQRLRPDGPLPQISLSTRFLQLRSLDLSYVASSLDDQGNFGKLTYTSCLVDDDLATLAGLNHLTTLSLRGCSLLTGRGLAYLATLPCLTSVDLTDCHGITDEPFSQGVLTGLFHVTALTLLGCRGLTNAALPPLAVLPRLRTLALPPGINDAGLKALSSAPSLQRVALRSSKGIGRDGIAALLAAPSLKRVVVSRCPLVSASGLDGIAPNLNVVQCAASMLDGGIANGGGLHGDAQHGHRHQQTHHAAVVATLSDMECVMDGPGSTIPPTAAADLRVLMANLHG